MGKRGPAPFPTNLRVLHGETKPSRVSETEPIPHEGVPVCPDTVSKEVREIWDYTLNELVFMGLATGADRDALVCYCEAVVAHRQSSAKVAERGVLLKGRDGETVTNPALRVQREAANQIRQYAQQFGLTPSARVGLKTPERDSGQAAERLLA